MSPRLVKYLYPDQITAFALNRLPVLYTTSPEGWMQQQQCAKEELAPPIAIALRQGLTAVPLKAGTLLPCCVSSQSFPITALLA